MKISLAQMQMSMDMEENLRTTLAAMEEASLSGSDLILFPEVQLTPFFPQYPAAMLEGLGIRKEAFSISMNDPKIEIIRERAKEKGMYCSPNFYVREEDGSLYDRSFFIDPQGEIVGTSDMVHIYTAENFNERDYYAPSREGFRVFDTPFGRIGIVICFDRHLAESVRACALQGALLVLIPTANLMDEPLDVFEAEVRAEAFQNNVFIAMCNRVGEEDAITFAGESIVIGPDGEVIAKADNTPQTLTVEVDLGQALRSRSKRAYIGFATPDAGVYHMAGESLQSDLPTIDSLFDAMVEHDAGDPKRVQHFTKVHSFARRIGHGEGLSVEEQNILEVAALVHDIGIRKAEKSFGSSDGKLQEKLGPGEAIHLLTDLGYPRKVIDRVAYLVGHHHTYDAIDGTDYQILVEADFLVNIFEDEMTKEATEAAFERIFKTKTGKKLFRQMYPE